MYYKEGQFYNPPEPPPPPLHVFTLEENKLKALSKLQKTDWVEVPSVTDVNNTPHLLNYDEFLAFRLQARDRAVNPQAGNLDWITKPTEKWSS
jgi:hypothetical protein